MALIFDRFNSRANAEKFAAAVTENHAVRASVYDSQEDSQPKDLNEITGENAYKNGVKDIFPFELTPPIVLVERSEDTDETVEELVEQFGGVFAGT